MMGRNVGGAPRRIKGRVSRQVSLCRDSDEKARMMDNFSAFVRGCLVGRHEGVPEESKKLVNVISARLYANHFDKEIKQWKSAEAEHAEKCVKALRDALNVV